MSSFYASNELKMPSSGQGKRAETIFRCMEARSATAAAETWLPWDMAAEAIFAGI